MQCANQLHRGWPEDDEHGRGQKTHGEGHGQLRRDLAGELDAAGLRVVSERRSRLGTLALVVAEAAS